MSDPRTPAVFLDPTGRRWRRVRGTVLVTSIATTVLAALLVAVVLIPPVLPALAGTRSSRELGRPPRWTGTRERRAHEAARRRLFATLERMRIPRAMRPEHLPIPAHAGLGWSEPKRDAVVAGFYVNWDDNAFASLRAHAAALDWVVCEWAFLGASGDTVALRIDRRVPFLLGRMAEDRRPAVLAMISNYDSSSRQFDAARLRRLVRSPAAMQRVSATLADATRRYQLAGIAVDFEEIPEDVRPGIVRFLRTLRAALDAPAPPIPGAPAVPPAARPLLVQAVGDGLPPADLRAYDAVTDFTVLMLYDEHYGAGDAGPVASEGWYERQARAALTTIPAAKLVLAVGAYGYDWNDGTPGMPADEMTFQDVMTAARRHERTPTFDRVSRTPYLQWTDPDSTDHVVWYLDGVTAYNEMVVGRRLGVAGHALWRLGAEDPSLWGTLDRTGLDSTARSLAVIPSGYDVEFEGVGELLRVAHRPTA